MTTSTGSTLQHLEGSASGLRYDADTVQGLDPSDGRPLLARYDLERARAVLGRETLAARRHGGMWRWSPILPVRDRRHVTYLGEGATPLLDAPRLGAALGAPRLRVKAEGLNPTGSFKARGMAAAISRAVELGVTSFVVPSAGNAGGAAAAYAAAAGATVTVLMPADVPAHNLDEVVACGATVALVDGLITDCGALARRVAEAAGAVDLATLKEPYRVEGKKTMGLELVEDLGWRVPDVVVYPTGGGTGIVGMWKAFDELETLGMLDGRRPRMVSVQAAGCAPIVRAFENGETAAAPWPDATTRASGIRVPSAVGDFLVLQILRASGGTAVAVEEDAISATQRTAGALGSGYVSPETAAALAALPLLRDAGRLSPTDEVVVFDTGVGHKYPAPAWPRPPVVAAGVGVEALLAALDDAATWHGPPLR